MKKLIPLSLLCLASVAAAQRGPATSATFSNFGSACGADLNGVVSSTLRIGFTITNAAADSFGAIVVGQPAATPIPLPIGACDLLLDPARRLDTMTFVTNANGSARIAFDRVPPAGLNISFQAIVITPDRATRTRTLASSNGTTLVTQ